MEPVVTRKTACNSLSCCTPNEKPIQIVHEGKIITFCEEECKVEFMQDPQKFLKSTHFALKFDDLEDASD